MKRSSKEFFEEYYRMNRESNESYEDLRNRQMKMFEEWYREMEVGDHAHVHLFSDDKPCTIIRKTAQSMTVRYDKAERDPNWIPEWEVGGFSANCTNNDEQRWIITEDQNGCEETFRWSNRMNCFQNNGCKLLPNWAKTYDYNF